MGELSAVLVTYLTACGLIWTGLTRLGEAMGPDAHKLGDVVQSFNLSSYTGGWSTTFIHGVDRILYFRCGTFGVMWPSLLRSFGLTFLFTLLLAYPIYLFLDWDRSPYGRFVYIYMFTFAVVAVSNLITDYISFVKTRFILGKISNSETVLARFTLPLLDILMTLLLAIVFTIIWVLIIAAVFDFLTPIVAGLDWTEEQLRASSRGAEAYLGSSLSIMVAVAVFSFVTSFAVALWSYLYLCALLVADVASKIDAVKSSLSSIVDFENRPSQASAVVTIGVFTILYAAVAVPWSVVGVG